MLFCFVVVGGREHLAGDWPEIEFPARFHAIGEKGGGGGGGCYNEEEKKKCFLFINE